MTKNLFIFPTKNLKILLSTADYCDIINKYDYTLQNAIRRLERNV